MNHLSIDIETFSDVDIKKAGLYRYVQSPAFEVLLFAYSVDGAPVQVVDLAQGRWIPAEILNALTNPQVLKHAYNAAFEWYCLSKYLQQICVNPLPVGYLMPLEQWRCTMLHGLYCGYTAGLAATGEALGLPQDKRKLGIGTSLIRTFCVPCKPTKSNGNRTRTLPQHEPEKWRLFKDYCAQDVVTEMEIERRLASFPVPEAEEKLWQLDQRINARGVRVDTQLVDSALAIDAAVTQSLTSEAIMLSGLSNPKSVQQLTKWLEEEIDEEVTDLRKETVKDLLKGDLESDAARRVLEIRQQLSKTSTKKYAAMREAVCDDSRVRGLLQFYGANRTGRWAGRLVQVQNLPQNHLQALDLARELAATGKADALQLLYGSVPDTLSQLIRTAFIPSDGHVFLVADFSAIEARVISWLAGEQWRMDVFATHGKIYEASASQMFGVPLEEITKDSP
ncbi:MAG TPA: DNA polymerase, partial [Clostridia bacterium]|nr:DNA polymerase [Clostridia bacterium]